MPTMLTAIALDLDASLAQVALVHSVHYLMYGLLQPAWGLFSDRFGRVRTIRVALAGTGVMALLAAAAPDLTILIVLRACGGAFLCGIVPTALVYVGDTVPFASRPRAFDGIVGWGALALAVATVVGGIAVGLDAWRAGLVVPAIFALVVCWQMALPEAPTHARMAGSFGLVLRRPLACFVIGLALIEGSVVFGGSTFWASAIETTGHSATVAGLAIAAFGAVTWAVTMASSRLARAVGPGTRLPCGGSLISLGFASAAIAPGLAGVVISCLFVGAGFAVFHPGLQTWATDVVPEARATMVSLYVMALFGGGAVASALAGGVAAAGHYSTLFGVAAIGGVVFTIAASVAWSRYVPSTTTAPAAAAEPVV